MESTTTESAGDSGSCAASNVIRIDGVLLLTGTVSLIFLNISWAFALFILIAVTRGAYFAILGDPDPFAISVATIIFLLPVSGVARLIGRGLLEGRKASAVVACILMIGFALIPSRQLLSGKIDPTQASGYVALDFVALTLSLLLIASSSRNRFYWGRVP